MKLATQVLLVAMFIVTAFAEWKSPKFKRLFPKEPEKPYHHDSRKYDYITYKDPGHSTYKDPGHSTNKDPGYATYKDPGHSTYKDPDYSWDPDFGYKWSDFYEHYPSDLSNYKGYEWDYDVEPAYRQLLVEFTGNMKVYGNGWRRSRLLSSMMDKDFYY